MPAQPVTLWERQLSEVPTTLSSWDNCMARNYCQYPVIAVIVVGSLILLSVIWCCVRCCCCGLNCCCGCFSCCNSCCPGPRGKRKGSKYADTLPPHPQWGGAGGYGPGGFSAGGVGGGALGGAGGGYKSPAPPSYTSQPARVYDQGPQFATFDASKKPQQHAITPDSLPAMPSWEQAHTRRVEDTNHQEEVEMERLKPADEQKAPMLEYQAPSPVGQGPSYGTGAVAAAAATSGPYQNRTARHGGDLGDPYDNDGYRDSHELQGSTVPMHQQYGSDQSPYNRGPQQSSYGQGSAAGYYTGDSQSTSYGIASQTRTPPPPHAYQSRTPEPQRQPSYGNQRTYGGLAVPQSPVSPPASAYSPNPTPRQHSVSPLAQMRDVPAVLRPARGNTPQSPQQSYPGYTPYAPPKQSTYTAYKSPTASGMPQNNW